MFDWLIRLPSAMAEASAPVAGAAAGTDPNSAGSLLTMFLPMILIVAVFYFLMIRPQRKKDKKVKDMLSALKVGDRICTIGGIYGTVLQLKDDSVTLAVGAQKTQLVMARWSIRSVEDAAVENDAEPQV